MEMVIRESLASPYPAAFARIWGDTPDPVHGYAVFYNTLAGGILDQPKWNAKCDIDPKELWESPLNFGDPILLQ